MAVRHGRPYEREGSMKKIACVLAAGLLTASVSARNVVAWGDDGHQIVARIAAKKLTPNTKRRIVAILRRGGDDQLHLPGLLGHAGTPSDETIAEAFSRMAIWPDHMPGGKGATAPWHFIDFGLFEGPNTSAERCEKGCVTELINRLRENVAVNRCLPTDDEEG